MIANSPPQNYKQTPVSDDGAVNWRREHKKHERVLWFYIALLIAGLLLPETGPRMGELRPSFAWASSSTWIHVR